MATATVSNCLCVREGVSVYFTTTDSRSRNGAIFTVGAARVGGALTVGVLGPSSPAAPTDGTVGAAGNLSRPYSWG